MQLYLRDLYLGTYYRYYMFRPIWAFSGITCIKMLRGLLHAVLTDPSLSVRHHLDLSKSIYVHNHNH
jgi:hypothetical protein